MSDSKITCYRCGKRITSGKPALRTVSGTTVALHPSCAKAGDKQLNAWKRNQDKK
jgi:hypothetical protein